ncbi:MAG: hypothetical protein IT162_05820, partial [Bryobacterales bacterium]|nr:hypothetical protein [Bryobacterales bacterium]
RMTRRVALGLALNGIARAAAPLRYAVFRSTDRGRSWAPAALGLTDTARINAFAVSGNVLLAGTDAGVFASRNQAQTWQPTPATTRILSFATLGETIYAGTAKSGLLVSYDAGANWQRDTTCPAQTIRALIAVGRQLYAGTDSQGAFVTSGSAWSPARAGLPDHAQIFALTALNGEVFAGLYAKGLYRWSAAGQQWRKTGPVVPLALATAGPALIAGHNPGGIWQSGDAGQTWQQGAGELSASAPIWEMGAGPPGELVVAGADTGIYTSRDHGRTWLRARTGLPARSPGIAFLVTPELVLAGAQLS